MLIKAWPAWQADFYSLSPAQAPCIQVFSSNKSQVQGLKNDEFQLRLMAIRDASVAERFDLVLSVFLTLRAVFGLVLCAHLQRFSCKSSEGSLKVDVGLMRSA